MMVEPYPAEHVNEPVEQFHDFMSSACHHKRHIRCGLCCQWCGVVCGCTCHDGQRRRIAAHLDIDNTWTAALVPHDANESGNLL